MTERRRIDEVHIQGFRGIDTLLLDFADGAGTPLDVVVIAGANGSGKTTVLEAILLALGHSEMLAGRANERVRFGRNVGAIRVKVQPGSALLGVQITNSGISPAYKATPPVPTSEYFSAHRPLQLLADSESPDHRTIESMRLRELERRLISTYYRSLRKRSLGQSAVFTRLQSIWQRFDPLQQRIEVLPRDNNPGSGDVVVLAHGPPIPDDVTSLAMARNLAPTRTDIPTMVPLHALSSGQMALFAFIGPLLFRDEPADIVLIDEPEQHLHVQWQRLLLPALRELCPDTQFIVATHSEEILESVLSYERFILVDSNDPRAHIGAAAE